MPNINFNKLKTLNVWHIFTCPYHTIFTQFLNNPIPFTTSSQIISSIHNPLLFESHSNFHPGTTLHISITNTFHINIVCTSSLETDYFKQVIFTLSIPNTSLPPIIGKLLCHYISDTDTLFSLSFQFESTSLLNNVTHSIATPTHIKTFIEQMSHSLYKMHNYSSHLYEKFYIEGHFSFILKLMSTPSITSGLLGKDENYNVLLKEGMCLVINVKDHKISNKDIVLEIDVRKVKITKDEFEVIALLMERNGMYPTEWNRFVVKRTKEVDKVMMMSEGKFDREISRQERRVVGKLKRTFFLKVFKIVNKNNDKHKKKKINE